MKPVIIDTSGWIEFFNKPESKIGDSAAKLIETDNAIIIGVVLAELLCGSRNKKESNKIQSLTEVLPYANTVPEDWVQAGTTLNNLRKKRITVPLTDALIAAMVKRNNYSILTLDKHFEFLAVSLV